jgi:hypothetical protein
MKKFAIGFSMLVFPALALAQYQLNSSDDIYTSALLVINKVVTFIIALTVVYTVLGAFRYAFGGEEEKSNWKEHILYGLIAIFVMVSIWGLVNILTGTFKLNNTSVPSTIPNVNTLRTSN